MVLQKNIKSWEFWLLILITWSLFVNTHSFFIEINTEQEEKCYMITTFPNENILLHIKLPVINDPIKVAVQCYVQGQKIFYKQIKKSQDKITVSLDESVSPGKIQQAYTCIRSTIETKDQKQIEIIRSKRYLIWFSQTGNFLKQVERKQKEKTKPDLKGKQSIEQIFQTLSKMNSTYQEQLSRYDNHVEMQSKNQQILYNIVNDMYIYGFIESIIIIGAMILYILVVRKLTTTY